MRAKTESASLYSPKKRKNTPVAMRTAARVLAEVWLCIQQSAAFTARAHAGEARAKQDISLVAADAVAAGVLLQGIEFAR